MPTLRRLIVPFAAAAALALAAPAAGAQGGVGEILDDYRADGRIDACAYTLDRLHAARAEVPADVIAYAPDFVVALDGAIAARPGCPGAAAPPVTGDGNRTADTGPTPGEPAEKSKGKSGAKGKAKGVPAGCRKLAGRKRARCVKAAKARAHCKTLKGKKKRAACMKQAKRKARG